jgi:hypothetical protein
VRQLDFIIVGAQKAGTTSYARYLREHPRVFIPPEKELPFFADEAMLFRGYDWFQRTYLAEAGSGQLIGTSTPQYLLYPDSFSRLREQFPDVRLVALLRDPMRRLVSHYDMCVRICQEQRSLDEAVRYQLDHIAECRAMPYRGNTINKYVVGGEYGRSIQVIHSLFDESQLLVIDFQRVITDRQGVLDDVCRFLSIDPFVPASIGQVEMRGGRSKKINIDHNRIVGWAASFVRRHPGLNALIPGMLRAVVRRGSSWMDRVNVDYSNRTNIDDISVETRERLELHYMEDKRLLEQLGYSMSWNYGVGNGNDSVGKR